MSELQIFEFYKSWVSSALNETKRSHLEGLIRSNTNQSSSFSTAYLIQDNQFDFLGQVSFLSLHSCANHILTCSSSMVHQQFRNFPSLQILKLLLYSALYTCFLFNCELHLNFRGKIFKCFIPPFRFTWFKLGLCSCFFLVGFLFVLIFFPLFNNHQVHRQWFRLSRFPTLTHCYWNSSSRIKTINSASIKSLGEKHGFLGYQCSFQVRFYFLWLSLELTLPPFPQDSTITNVFFWIWSTWYKLLLLKHSFLIIPLLRILKTYI